ncbi:IS1 family transposase [Flavobacterium sp. HNIBRBA15423]|uniref:IS1 family transposase n=1 Tax=Flavobacterium sp. HNIBRBA15423 TaxID=3458683 RepID=UPI004043C157
MVKKSTSCIKISDAGICPYCNTKNLVKNGFTKNKKQQFYCKNCYKRCIDFYCYKAYKLDVNIKIIQFIKEGLGIRSTARILQISTTTVLKRIIAITKKNPNPIFYKNKIYEVDEMRCYLKHKDKPMWIVYALEKKTKQVVSFSLGRRSKRTIQYVINSLLLSFPKNSYTDGLMHYKSLINSVIHKIKRFGTNQIERNNLTMRTHLKRLQRKTICFSRSFILLQCVLRIYFWG